jgi:glycosyltransferase involved in cell wall biosynthesis
MLFVSSQKSTNTNAYYHRIFNLEKHIRNLGVSTSRLFLRDLFFDSPVRIQILNIPFILRYLRQFDVIHAGGNDSAFFFAVASRFLRKNTIIIYDVHADILTESHLIPRGKYDALGRFMESEMLLSEYVASSSIKYFIASSPVIKKRLLQRNYDNIRSENIEIVINGVDIADFSPSKDIDFSPDNHTFTVTYAGSYGAIEAVDNLVIAAELLKEENLLFKFVGFKEEEQAIKLEIKQKLGKKAVLLDWMPRNKLVEEMHNSDVLVIPADSRDKKQSINRSVVFVTKFAEYLATGKPIIVTKIDLVSKIVETIDCGFVCNATPESIAKCIMQAKETSTVNLQRKGQNGRRYAETDLDINKVCKAYLNFINNLLNREIRKT